MSSDEAENLSLYGQFVQLEELETAKGDQEAISALKANIQAELISDDLEFTQLEKKTSLNYIEKLLKKEKIMTRINASCRAS